MRASTGGASVLLLAGVATLSLAAAPTVGPQQRVDANGGTAAANETTAAASAVDPDTIIGAWNDWRPSTQTQEIIRCGVTVSTDGGATWNDFVLRPPAPNQSGVEGDPMTATDPRTGVVWAGAISFAGNGGIYVARMNPGDGFFQPSVMVDLDQGQGLDKCWMVAGRNHLTADSTRLYVGYNKGLARSDDMGDTWTNPVSLGQGLGFLPRIGPNGEVYVAYWDYTTEAMRVKRSLDGGTSFTTHLVALRMDTWGVETFNTRFPGTFRAPALLGLAVHPVNGTLYAVWPDTTDFSQPGGHANVDVYFSKSTNQGTSWSTPAILNDEGPFVGDQFFPWIETDPANGRLNVVLLDTRNTDQVDNTTHGMIDSYFAYSEDDGATWTELRLTPQPWDSDDDGLNRPSQFIGDYLGMAVTADLAWPLYPDSQNGDTDTYTNRVDFCAEIDEIENLTLGRSGSTLSFYWNDTPAAVDYVVYQDLSAQGGFLVPIGTSTSGVTGLTIPMPFGNRYYLVAGRNGCGTGPK